MKNRHLSRGAIHYEYMHPFWRHASAKNWIKITSSNRINQLNCCKLGSLGWDVELPCCWVYIRIPKYKNLYEYYLFYLDYLVYFMYSLPGSVERHFRFDISDFGFQKKKKKQKKNTGSCFSVFSSWGFFLTRPPPQGEGHASKFENCQIVSSLFSISSAALRQKLTLLNQH